MRINRSKEPTRTQQETEHWCSEFELLCRARGIRLTPQRLAVYRALAEDLTHPTAESVYRKLSELIPGLSQATVYRTLEFLERENLIKRVSAPEGVGRFDANVGNHQHLVCRVCGSLSDVSLPELDKKKLPSVAGFTVDELDIRLVGRCAGCSNRKSGRGKAVKPN